ncbi:hypothetical protein ACKAMS_24655 [Rhodococcus sp. 5A-K4]
MTREFTEAERAWLDKVAAARKPATAQQLDLIRGAYARSVPQQHKQSA